MMILVIGNPDSGKSKIAEDKVTELASGKKVIYLATMMPSDDEAIARIMRHKARRAGKSFATIESPVKADAALIEYIEENETFDICLLECVSNLVGNEMHHEDNAGLSDEDLAKLILDEIKNMNENLSVLVAVTNEFERSPEYSEETLRYIDITDRVNEGLIRMSDEVIDTRSGA